MTASLDTVQCGSVSSADNWESGTTSSVDNTHCLDSTLDGSSNASEFLSGFEGNVDENNDVDEKHTLISNEKLSSESEPCEREKAKGKSLFRCDKYPKQYIYSSNFMRHYKRDHLIQKLSNPRRNDKQIKKPRSKCAENPANPVNQNAVKNKRNTTTPRKSLKNAASPRDTVKNKKTTMTSRKYLETAMRHALLDTDILECRICCRKFTSAKRLSQHLRARQHQSNNYQLIQRKLRDYVRKKATAKQNNKRKKTNIKQKGPLPRHTCKICQKSLSQSSLVNHMRLHSGEKPFACEFCSKAFPRKNDLILHRRTHTGEKPYVCNTCGHAFTQPSSLVLHNRKQHNQVGTYKCNSCPRGYTKFENLAKHKLVCKGKSYGSQSVLPSTTRGRKRKVE